MIGIGLTIKWPNDLFFAGKKVGGILCEGVIRDQTFESPVIGVGINLNLSPDPEACDLKQIMRSPPPETRVFAEDLADYLITQWQGYDLTHLREDLNTYGLPAGSLWWQPGKLTSIATQIGLDDSCYLQLDQQGTLQSLSSAHHDFKPMAPETHLLGIADCGNTRAKLSIWGAAKQPLWSASFTAAETTEQISEQTSESGSNSPELFTAQQVAADLRQFLVKSGLPMAGVFAARSGQKSGKILRQALQTTGLGCWPTPKRPIRLNSSYDVNAIGIDRLAGMEAALSLLPTDHRGSVLVVSCGTATTVDAVSSAGVHQGGFIGLGLKSGLESLHQHTAALPLIAPIDSSEGQRLGMTTRACMAGGIAQMIVGMILRACALTNQVQPLSKIFLTGGDAPLIADLLEMPLRATFSNTTLEVDPFLTSRGYVILVRGGSL